MARISFWNPERGFGFAEVDGHRVFVHAISIVPRPARGEDLTGQEIVVDGVDWEAPKGPRATTVLVPPDGVQWHLDDYYCMVVQEGFRGSNQVSRKEFFLNPRRRNLRKGGYMRRTRTQWSLVGEIDSEGAEDALAAGCPPELIEEARKRITERLAAEVEQRRLVEEALRAAAALAGEGVIPLLLPAERPRPNQWLEPRCIERFNAAWEEFTAEVRLVGSNARWRWGTVPKGTEVAVEAEFGYSYLRCTWSPPTGRGVEEAARRAGILIPRISQGDGAPWSKSEHFDETGQLRIR